MANIFSCQLGLAAINGVFLTIFFKENTPFNLSDGFGALRVNIWPLLWQWDLPVQQTDIGELYLWFKLANRHQRVVSTGFFGASVHHQSHCWFSWAGNCVVEQFKALKMNEPSTSTPQPAVPPRVIASLTLSLYTHTSPPLPHSS